MLSPLAPVPHDPRFREKLAQYRRDLAARTACPADWGRIDPRAARPDLPALLPDTQTEPAGNVPAPGVAQDEPAGNMPVPCAVQDEPAGNVPAPSVAQAPAGQETAHHRPGHGRHRHRRRP